MLTQSPIICPVSLRAIQALKGHRQNQITPQEFLSRHPGSDANVLAIAANTSPTVIYGWGVIRGKRGSDRQRPPQEHHLVLLAEASEFFLNL